MYEFWILITASMVASSCALIGSLLILRRMSMLGDAISHSVLLGIVLVYLWVGHASLHWMLFGAALVGLITAWLSQFIHQHAHITPDASLGLVFTWLFSLAIILIALYADHVHLDQEHVLFGEMAFIPFTTLTFADINLGPQAFWLALIVLLINLIVLGVGFERFKLTSFHPTLALTLGVQVAVWHYVLMTLVSFTVVASFDVVGAILVVALLVIPASTAYLFAKSLKQMLWLAWGFSQIAVLVGFLIAVWLDTVISASIGATAGLVLLLVLIIKQLQQRTRPGG